MKLIPNWNEHLRLYVGASCFIRGCSLPLCCHWGGYTMDLQLPQIMRTFWWKDLGWRNEKPEKLDIPNSPSPTQPGCVWAWRISAQGGGDKALLFHSQLVWSCEIPSAESFTDPCPRSLPMSQPSGEHAWPFQPQCSWDLKAIIPERDVAPAHGSPLSLLCSLGRGGQHCSSHPRFSISSIFQLFPSLKKTDEPDSLHRSWHLSPAVLASPHPLPFCVGAHGSVHLICDRQPQEHQGRIIKSWNHHQGWNRPPRSSSPTANLALPRKASSPSLSAACCPFRIYFVPLL